MAPPVRMSAFGPTTIIQKGQRRHAASFENCPRTAGQSCVIVVRDLRCPVQRSKQRTKVLGGRDVMRLLNALMVVLAAATFGAPGASAQVSDDVVRIGVLNDQSGLYADLGGQGSVVAARMAVEDAGGSVLGKPV
jgi:hypothetical protein